MKTYALILALEVAGALIALYLINKRKKSEKVVCVIGGKCGTVLESKYNRLFGVVHNDIMGLLYYLAMIASLNLIMYEVGPMEILLPAIKAMAALGAGMGVLFMFIQWRVLKAWCFWCILSNINTWIIAALIFNTF